MNKILVIVAFFMLSSTYAQQSKPAELHWETDFEVAKKKSKKYKKPILMLFTGSDWCPPCKLLKKDFINSEEFKTKSTEFVLLLVDFPKNKANFTSEQENHNKELNSAYGVRSLPTLIAVNAEGHIIDKIKNYSASRNTNAHFEFLERVLN
ncbi:MAG: thioredoxin family protein [Flavobacteriaceae bacterium]